MDFLLTFGLLCVAEATKYRTDKGDSFFSQPNESYPPDKSLALTQAFIYDGHNKSNSAPQLKQSTVNAMHIFEQNVLWIYILIGVILLTAIIVGIVCCCLKGDDKKKDEDKMNEEEGEPMMDPEMMEPAADAM